MFLPFLQQLKEKKKKKEGQAQHNTTHTQDKLNGIAFVFWIGRKIHMELRF